MPKPLSKSITLTDPDWLEIEREYCSRSLLDFCERAWNILEPKQRVFKRGWALDAMAEHLEAVSYGEIGNLLMNVPPGFMKSLLTRVFWPAWEWGPLGRPDIRYVTASYSDHLSTRDARRMRMVVTSPWYKKLWPKVKISADQAQKMNFHNTENGFMLGTSVRGVGTGERGDRFVIDDPNSVKAAESEAVRNETNFWFQEVVPSRLNEIETDPIIVIQQRVHESDVSGLILAEGLDYEHLCLPMHYEPDRKCHTSIGFEDPREEDGELLFPERFSEAAIQKMVKQMGSDYAVAGQLQQRPAPRGGGIIKREWWQLWSADTLEAQKQYLVKTNDMGDKSVDYPPFTFIVASLDTAYTEKQENDSSALTIWGIWHTTTGAPRIMLVGAWEERLGLNKLVNRVAKSCQRFKVDTLLVESKASGISVIQEIRRLYEEEPWSVISIDPKGDKVARMHTVEPIFSQGVIYAPDTEWAEKVIGQVSTFPKGAHDDTPDSVSQAINWLRSGGWALRDEEHKAHWERSNLPGSRKVKAVYDV